MKQLLILLACLFLSNMSFALPTKKVLVSLKPNERLMLGEYTSNFYADTYNFMCLLYDSETGKKTIIYNGIRKITANDIDFYYIDLDDFNKSIYEYTTDNGKYIHIENEICGPYEKIEYYADCCKKAIPIWGDINTGYFNRNEFSFTQMGEEYIHYNDGTIYKIGSFKSHYMSPNKMHECVVDISRRMVTIDNINYVLPIPVDVELYDSNPQICLFDDGTCYYQHYFKNDGAYQGVTAFGFYITPSEVKAIDTDVEVFDLDTHKIKALGNIQDYNEYDDPHNFCYYLPKEVYLPEKGYYIFGWEFSLQDESRKHSLFAKWDYDYILIDGKKYNYHCPVDAFYDNKSNSFKWVSFENNQIVMYNYSL